MKTNKIFIAGHRGMVGQALVRQFQGDERWELLTAGRAELDLTRQTAVEQWMQMRRPEAVIVAAAKVGGIHANATYPADFIYENLMIAANLIHAAFQSGVRRLLFLGSSCIYPRAAPQPMTEDCLLTSPLEATNEAYALAKIAGLKLCQHYRSQHGVLFHSVMPTNLYGPGDNYHAENSHVIPGLIRRFHEAKQSGAAAVAVWGSGEPRREFLHVDDLAAACAAVMELDNPPDWVNAGCGEEIRIRDLALLVAEAVGYQGAIVFDVSRPDGTPRKLLDISLLNQLGWRPRIRLRDGLRAAYEDFLNGARRGG
jgi:GDP-L-fucose synthase